MFLKNLTPPLWICSVPRRCGGVPGQVALDVVKAACSPQVRGCSFKGKAGPRQVKVFPAGAGVFPLPVTADYYCPCVPRRCGGVPVISKGSNACPPCSPQVRGCSYHVPADFRADLVFPAGAGVFPEVILLPMDYWRVPRRCGGVPKREAGAKRLGLCSPQVRGCSPRSSQPQPRCRVFPAGAGVFPGKGNSAVGACGVPRRCGGVPASASLFEDGTGVPRRCGGVPSCDVLLALLPLCSPQVRGCSLNINRTPNKKYVFPAGAGVFPDPLW